jgi:hypothetical protein
MGLDFVGMGSVYARARVVDPSTGLRFVLFGVMLRPRGVGRNVPAGPTISQPDLDIGSLHMWRMLNESVGTSSPRG